MVQELVINAFKIVKFVLLLQLVRSAIHNILIYYFQKKKHVLNAMRMVTLKPQDQHAFNVM